MPSPPTKLFVFVDTSVLVRIATQGQKGCELELWRNLKDHVTRKAVTLLVPEVVLLEFRAKREDVKAEMGESCRRLQQHLGTDGTLYNEISDLKDELEPVVNGFLTKRIADFDHRWEDIYDFVSGEHSTAIPFDEQILLRYRKRAISKSLPKGDRRKQQELNDYWSHDVFCVDSIIEFLASEKHILDECRLALCTDNLGDFAITEGDSKGALKDVFEDGLPVTEVFKTLQQMSKFLEGAPTPPEVVEEVKEELELETAQRESEAVRRGYEIGALALAEALAQREARAKTFRIRLKDGLMQSMNEVDWQAILQKAGEFAEKMDGAKLALQSVDTYQSLRDLQETIARIKAPPNWDMLGRAIPPKPPQPVRPPTPPKAAVPPKPPEPAKPPNPPEGGKPPELPETPST